MYKKQKQKKEKKIEKKYTKILRTIFVDNENQGELIVFSYLLDP